MSALDILPPSAPSVAEERRPGFLSKLFKRKKEPAAVPEEPSGFGKEFDIDDIKRKIGVEEPSEAPSATASAPDTEQSAPPPEPEEPLAEPPPPEEPLPELPASEQPLPEMPPERPEPKEPIVAERQPSFEEAPPALPADAPKPEYDVKDWSESHDAPQEDSGSEWSEHASEQQPASGESEWATSAPPVEEPAEAPPAPEAPAEQPAAPPPEPKELAKKKEEKPAKKVAKKAEEKRPEKKVPAAGKPAKQPTAGSWDAPAVAEPPQVEPVEPVEAAAFDTHLKRLATQHKQLDEKLQQLLKPEKELPPKEHPLDRAVPQGQEFILKDGTSLKTLRDLLAAVKTIDKETFLHHVNEHKNDFANWIEHVLQEEQLAGKMRQRKAKKELLRILTTHEKELDRRFKEEEKRLDESLQGRAAKIAAAGDMDRKLGELHGALTKKSELLADQRRLIDKEVGKRLTKELARRLRSEKAALRQEQRAAEQKRKGYEQQRATMEQSVKQQYDELERKLADREQKLAAKQESLKRLEGTLRKERERLAEEQRTAKPLIDEATAAKATLEKLKKDRALLAADAAKLKKETDAFATKRRSVTAKAAALAKREKDARSAQEQLNRREQELTKQAAVLKRDREALAKEQAAFADKQKSARAEEKKVHAKLEQERKRLDQRIKKAQTVETKAEEKLKERRKIAKYIEEAEQGFEQRFLGPATPSDLPPAESIRNLKIYTMIDQARQALDDGALRDARDLYNKIRAAFNKEDLTPSEKSVLYNTIRELYDDIHLASLK